MNAYQVTLINLVADAGSTGAESRVEHGRMSREELHALLVNFCQIDAVEHATLEPEIRVQVRAESYVLRAGHKNLVLYDALNRSVPGQVVSVEEAMAEFDGSAQAARTAVPWQTLQAAARPAVPVAVAPSPRAKRVRRVCLATATLGLLALAGLMHWNRAAEEAEPGYVLVPADERAAIQSSLAGVYLTGSEPGDHGLVVMPTGEVRLFEFRGGEVPRVVNAGYRPARVGGTLALVTDQPGGVALVRDADTVLYSGETYSRIR